jgi:hypothetical protein
MMSLTSFFTLQNVLIIILFFNGSLKANDDNLRFPFETLVWDTIKPYLITSAHPAKQTLDKIFSQQRVTASMENMINAGFVCKQSFAKNIIVAAHPELKGYLIKTYLDGQKLHKEDWKFCVDRIKGANKIRKTLDVYGYHNMMKVPHKWIYALPNKGNIKTINPENQQRNFLLLVEDMEVLDPLSNHIKYEIKMTKRKLNALYNVITQNLLMDSVYIRNIPFCKDGKIAFVDTETFRITKEVICYECLASQLSPKMQIYWRSLFEN